MLGSVALEAQAVVEYADYVAELTKVGLKICGARPVASLTVDDVRDLDVL